MDTGDHSRSNALLEQLDTRWDVQERPFRSSTPLIGPLLARLRAAWNNVATRWYVFAILEQQNHFNHLVVQQLRGYQAQLQALDMRLQDFDARLAAQDRDQSAVVHDMAELTAQVAQLRRLLEAAEQRLAHLEANGPAEPSP